MGFLKTILIFLLVYYALKILLKLFAPQLFRFAAKKTEKHFREKFGDFADTAAGGEGPESRVNINKKPPKKSNSKEKVGEYIDFEEID